MTLIDILEVTFDCKDDFRDHLLSVFRAASQRLGYLRKSWRVFNNIVLLERCSRGFDLPVLESFSAVWSSPAESHLKLIQPP